MAFVRVIGGADLSDTNDILNAILAASGGSSGTDQTRLDYDVRTDSNPVYVGEANQGVATSASEWIVKKLYYDASNRLTRIKAHGNVAWDNRSILDWT